MPSTYYNFSYEDIFYIITTEFYYIVIHYLFIQQQTLLGANRSYNHLLNINIQFINDKYGNNVKVKCHQ